MFSVPGVGYITSRTKCLKAPCSKTRKRTGAMALWAKYLLYKHEDPSVDLQKPWKKPGVEVVQ